MYFFSSADRSGCIHLPTHLPGPFLSYLFKNLSVTLHRYYLPPGDICTGLCGPCLKERNQLIKILSSSTTELYLVPVQLNSAAPVQLPNYRSTCLYRLVWHNLFCFCWVMGHSSALPTPHIDCFPVNGDFFSH